MFTRPFLELSRSDAPIAGGKGASLGEMTQAGIPVPPGFVVLSDSFERFIEETDLNVEIDNILNDVDTEKMHTVEHASETIQKFILEAEMPEDIAESILEQFRILCHCEPQGRGNPEEEKFFVAVRSSATAEDSDSAAWAGQLDSFLNTTEETLLENVKRCWASLFTPRAIFYRFEKHLHDTKISVAVVVQKMVESEVSGIAFSVHPVTEDRNQLIIEAGYGLGEAIVSGQITPDSYVVEKEPRRIIDKNVAEQERGIYRTTSVIPSISSVIPAKAGIQEEKEANEWRSIPSERRSLQKLSDEQILELTDLIVKIENHYGFPCDIEWAYEVGRFFIVQSRPITTLPTEITTKFEFERLFTRDTSLIIFEVWYDAFTKGTVRLFGKNPIDTPIIDYMHDGLVDIYESRTAMSWFRDRLLLWCKSNEKDFYDEMQRYEEGISSLGEIYKKQRCNSVEELIDFIKNIGDVYVGFAIMYFVSIDDRHNKNVLERARNIRDNDNFFEINDKVIRNSLRYIYPEISDLEKSILMSEIKRPPEKDELERRLRHFLFAPGLVIEAIEFNDFRKIHKEIDFVRQDSLPDSLSVTCGEVAQKGIVIGRVKKILLKSRIDSIEEGDVVVAHMTTPDFGIALNKASAIVTDEGGIMSHAAIVSRELKKPCIIGTKIATQVLHDGDIVEVDADNGVVRVLEKNKS